MTRSARSIAGTTLFAAYDFILCGFCKLFAMGLAAVVFLTGLDVTLRYFAIGNVPWLLEVFEYTLFVGTFLAAPWALRQGAHVRIDIAAEFMGPRAAVALEMVADLCGLLLSALLVYYGAAAALEAHVNNMIQYKTLYMPESVLLAAIPVSGLLLGIEFALRLGRVQAVLKTERGLPAEEGR